MYAPLLVVFSFVIAALVTIYLVPLLIATAQKLRIVDAPDGHLKVQKQETPYLGGVAIYVGFITALALTFPFENRMFLMLVGTTLLLFIGLIDDLIVLRPYQKLFGQMIASFCFLKGGFYLKETFLFSTGSAAALIFWIIVSYGWMLAMINACNLVDVMDGLLATVALCATISFLLIAQMLGLSTLMILLAAFAGALSGFLWFNLPVARIYLGDAGSLFIGGFLAIVPFMIPWGTFHSYGYIIPLIILLIPLLEEGTLILIRSYYAIPFYQGSPHHFSIYLRNKGWSVQQVLAYIVAYALMLLMLVIGFIAGKISLLMLFSAVIALVLFWYYLILF